MTPVKATLHTKFAEAKLRTSDLIYGEIWFGVAARMGIDENVPSKAKRRSEFSVYI